MRTRAIFATFAGLAMLAGSQGYAAEAAAPVTATLKYRPSEGVIEVKITNISGAPACLGHESGAPTHLQLWKHGKPIELPYAFEGRPPATCHMLEADESWIFVLSLERLAGKRIYPDRACHIVTWRQHVLGPSTFRRFCARL